MNVIAHLSPHYNVFPASFAHVREMGEIMRHEDAMEAAGLGGDPAHMLRYSYRMSIWSAAATVDNQLAAVWGINSGPFSAIGTPWLITAPAMDKASPWKCLRIGRAQAEAMLSLRSRLENIVDGRYTRAIRFLKLLGFHVELPQPHPETGIPFSRFWMQKGH